MSNRVPSGWEAASFGDLCKFSGGSAFKEKYQGQGWGDYPFIKVSDMNIEGNQRFITKANHWIDQDTRLEAKVKVFPERAVVFAKVGAALLLNRRRILTRETAIDNNMMAAIPYEDGHNFLYYVLQEVDLGGIVQDGAVPSVNQAQMEDIPVLIPPLPEQQKIATILSSVDDVIEKTRAQIDKLKDLKTGMMQELLTKGIGHTEFKDSPLGRIPVAWEVAELSSVTKVIDCKHATPKYFDEGFPVIKPGNIKEGNINLLGCALTDEDGYKNLNENHKPCKGDTVYSRNQTYGVGAYVNENMDFAIGQDVCVIHPVSCFPKFIYYAVNAPVVREQVELLAAGSTFKRINLGSIRKLNIPIPPNHEQAKIASVLSGFDSKITALESKQLANLDLKKALMQDLLTGKVRVKPNESAAR